MPIVAIGDSGTSALGKVHQVYGAVVCPRMHLMIPARGAEHALKSPAAVGLLFTTPYALGAASGAEEYDIFVGGVGRNGARDPRTAVAQSLVNQFNR